METYVHEPTALAAGGVEHLGVVRMNRNCKSALARIFQAATVACDSGPKDSAVVRRESMLASCLTDGRDAPEFLTYGANHR